MTIHIGLLRAVNLGGHNKVGTADLRELLAGLGMQNVRSLLQTGNLVFRSDVRTANDWRVMIAGNPFPEEVKRDPSHLLVMVLKKAPDRDDVTTLQRAITGREVVRAKGRHAYVVYPDGIGRSRLTSALIEKKLGTRGTGRNWNTVLELGSLTGTS